MTRGLSASNKPVVFAVLSALLFGLGTPFAKLLLGDMPPVALAGLLYLGAFVGLSLFDAFRRAASPRDIDAADRIRRSDLPWLLGAIVFGGVIAPICLMLGLDMISGFSASLLLNLEGVTTAIIAATLFREHLDRRIILAIVCMTTAGILLSWSPEEGELSVVGPLLLLGAAVGWGVDNNLTRNICARDPVRIAQVRGLVAGSASTTIAIGLGWQPASAGPVAWAMILGAISYGASLVLFVLALQGMGASRTGAFFSLGPFVGAMASLVLLGEWLGWIMLPAAALMLVGAVAVVYERHSHSHAHGETVHAHLHSHDDSMHDHHHLERVSGQHVHEHVHSAVTHDHVHWPDIHHRHGHDGKSQK